GRGPPKQSQLFGLLAGVLAIGNIAFKDHGDGHRATVADHPEEKGLLLAAKRMGVEPDDLETALTTVTLVVGK
ncbi:unnamed protein product, partial [Choristocarpus tenellus]